MVMMVSTCSTFNTSSSITVSTTSTASTEPEKNAIFLKKIHPHCSIVHTTQILTRTHSKWLYSQGTSKAYALLTCGYFGQLFNVR